MINVGIIGAGHGVRVLAPAISMLSDARVVALATRSETSLSAARNTLKIDTFTTNWRDLVNDPNIDALAIAVPASAQMEIAVAAFEAGKQVFLEKPLATALVDAETIAHAADQKGMNPAVDFIFPTLAPWQSMHTALMQKNMGEIVDINLEWRALTYANKHKLDNWKTRSIEGGGTLLNFASHSFHYLSWLFGDVVSIQATLSKADDDPRDGDTRVNAMVTFANNVRATIDINAAHAGDPCHRLSVQGSERTLLLENITSDYVRGFTFSDGSESSEPFMDAEIEAFEGDGRTLATARIIEPFLRTTSSPPGLGVHDALKTQQILDAAHRSHLSGRPMVAGQDF